MIGSDSGSDKDNGVVFDCSTSSAAAGEGRGVRVLVEMVLSAIRVVVVVVVAVVVVVVVGSSAVEAASVLSVARIDSGEDNDELASMLAL